MLLWALVGKFALDLSILSFQFNVSNSQRLTEISKGQFTLRLHRSSHDTTSDHILEVRRKDQDKQAFCFEFIDRPWSAV